MDFKNSTADQLSLLYPSPPRPMPYVDLWSEGDYASIWYTTNSKFGNVGGFKPGRPTVLMLHPTFLDSSWLHNQFGDPRLSSDFNLIAIDMRVCGKSVAEHSGKHDSWVEAADLAFVHRVRPCGPSCRFTLILNLSRRH